MRHLFFCCVFLLILLNSAFGDSYLNFYIGNISIEVNGERIPPKTGMSLPRNAILKTGFNGKAYIYDDIYQTVKIVQSDKVIIISHAQEQGADNLQKSIFDKFKKEQKSNKTCVVAIRGNEEGKIDMSWATGEDLIPDHSDAWALYKQGDYKKILPLTNKSKDYEGRFLFGVSLYQVYGITKADESLKELAAVLKSPLSEDIKSKANLTIAHIYFETGKYDLAVKYITDAVRHTPEEKISETSYYLLVSINRIIGNEVKADYYKKKMGEYYRSSDLYMDVAK